MRQSGSRLRGDSLPAVDYQSIRARPADENHFIAGEPQPQISSRNNSSSYSSKSVIKSKDFDVGSASEKIMNSQGSQSEPVELNIPDAIQEAETPRKTVPEPERHDQLAAGEQSVLDSGFEVKGHNIDNGNSMVDNEQFKTAQILEVQQNTPREQATEDGEQFEHVEEMQENNKEIEDLNENEIEIERVKNNITEREFFVNDQAFEMSNKVQFQQQRQQRFQNQQNGTRDKKTVKIGIETISKRKCFPYKMILLASVMLKMEITKTLSTLRVIFKMIVKINKCCKGKIFNLHTLKGMESYSKNTTPHFVEREDNLRLMFNLKMRRKVIWNMTKIHQM